MSYSCPVASRTSPPGLRLVRPRPRDCLVGRGHPDGVHPSPVFNYPGNLLLALISVFLSSGVSGTAPLYLPGNSKPCFTASPRAPCGCAPATKINYVAASQEERHRLARGLPDSVKQQLFVIQTAAATPQTRFDGDSQGAREAIAQVRTSAREAITEMQAMLDQLRAAPLENTGSQP